MRELAPVLSELDQRGSKKQEENKVLATCRVEYGLGAVIFTKPHMSTDASYSGTLLDPFPSKSGSSFEAKMPTPRLHVRMSRNYLADPYCELQFRVQDWLVDILRMFIAQYFALKKTKHITNQCVQNKSNFTKNNCLYIY